MPEYCISLAVEAFNQCGHDANWQDIERWLLLTIDTIDIKSYIFEGTRAEFIETVINMARDFYNDLIEIRESITDFE